MTTPAKERTGHTARILRLAVPLILSMTGFVAMQITDGILLSRYSPLAIAAAGTAGMATFMLNSIFVGAAGYTATLTAQYFGAERHERIGCAVWQGIYFSLLAGVAVAGAGFLGKPIFNFVGHAPEVRQLEVQYFTICCLGMPAALLSSALSGFFSGRGSTKILMKIQLAGLLLNVILDYGLIFGRLGLPRMGVPGAAIATVASQAAGAVGLAVLFLRKTYRDRFATWSGRAFNGDMMRRLVRFGLPGGLRFGVEILAWTAFLFVVGRIGTTELASTNIAWRINGLAFFPIIGLSEAVRALVGQAQGRQDPHESVAITLRGLLIAEVWMVSLSLCFLLFPGAMYGIFGGRDPDPAFVEVARQGRILLRFVAAYCLLDAFNIILCGALLAAGDTHWSLIMSVGMHGAFVAALVVGDRLGVSLHGQWTIATVFVMTMALIWIARFHGGRWKHIRVIEHT